MNSRSMLYYEARVGLGWSSLLPALAGPAYAVLLWLVWLGRGRPEMIDLVRAFELGFPLMVALSAAHLMAVEREEGFSELRASYPEPRWRLPLLRTAGALTMGALSLLLAWACFRATWGAFPVSDVILPGVGPALYLLGISLLVSNITGSYWAAAGTAMGYWFFDLFTRGQQTKGLFLFQLTWPVDGVDYGDNRYLLGAIGLLLMGISVGVSLLRRSRV